jgi:hypothetical protein
MPQKSPAENQFLPIVTPITPRHGGMIITMPGNPVTNYMDNYMDTQCAEINRQKIGGESPLLGKD